MSFVEFSNFSSGVNFFQLSGTVCTKSVKRIMINTSVKLLCLSTNGSGGDAV